ncbi:MAG: taurine dioxygenase [Alphaproteobacteria bacterium]|nr:taurine dioxygenase [Alphaproteobacteria bacterium]
MGSNALEIKPIAGALGAEIGGVDLADPLDDVTFQQIHRALLDNGVIFFRDQRITPDQQLAFAKRWGDIHLHPHIQGLDGTPEVFEIVKKEDDVHTLGGEWHTDQMFTATPVRATMLYAKQVPPQGGDTLFANAYLAYDTLSDGMKAMLAGLRTVNSYNMKKKRAAAMQVNDANEAPPDAEHPLIRTHNETGRKALYISYEGITKRLAGMTDAESAPLLGYRRQHATRPEFTCRFRWEEGSLAVWDNRCVQHLAINDYHGYRRVMHRVTVNGEPTS